MSRARLLLTLSWTALVAACGTEVVYDDGGTQPSTTSGQGGATTGGAADDDRGVGARGNDGVLCPDTTCPSGTWCLECRDMDGGAMRMCRDTFEWPDDVCPNLAGPIYVMCDGAEDCPAGEICSVSPKGDGTYIECSVPSACEADCSCPDGLERVCRDVADCAACASSCDTRPDLPVAVCR